MASRPAEKSPDILQSTITLPRSFHTSTCYSCGPKPRHCPEKEGRRDLLLLLFILFLFCCCFCAYLCVILCVTWLLNIKALPPQTSSGVVLCISGGGVCAPSEEICQCCWRTEAHLACPANQGEQLYVVTEYYRPSSVNTLAYSTDLGDVFSVKSHR